MERNGVSLYGLIDYEVRNVSRYRRYASVLLVASREGTQKLLIECLKSSIRSSDELFEIPEGAAIIMGETDKHGALVVARRLREQYNGTFNMRIGVASCPEDAMSPDLLMTSGLRRLNKAIESPDKGVVSCDEPCLH